MVQLIGIDSWRRAMTIMIYGCEHCQIKADDWLAFVENKIQ